MSTPSSTLFRGMDSSFLEYWKDVRTLAFGEVPDYNLLKSRFSQCWERKGFGSSPGEYDWPSLFNRFKRMPLRRMCLQHCHFNIRKIRRMLGGLGGLIE
jgi:hypothetical protein